MFLLKRIVQNIGFSLNLHDILSYSPATCSLLLYASYDKHNAFIANLNCV